MDALRRLVRPWSGAALLAGLVMIVSVTAAGGSARGSQVAPGSGDGRAQAGATPSGFRGIILPDLLIVVPSGLTPPDVAGLRAINGVRKLVTFDGAQVMLAGRPVSVIGVDPEQFRSWVPLRAASDQALWTDLAAGELIASGGSAAPIGLAPGTSYQLTGQRTLSVPFAGSARLGVTGVDFLVNQSISGKLGLVHQVAALISAPGPKVSTLTRRVRQILGAGAEVVVLRRSRLPLAATVPGQITNYLQLFRAAAATYCPSLSWTVLAAIGQIESGDGQNMGPSSAGALGPMQFLPSTWAAWGIDGFGPPGPPDVMNPLDAVPSAAKLLCADGASAGTPAGLRQAIFDYNHATWYVNEVLALAARYAAEYH